MVISFVDLAKSGRRLNREGRGSVDLRGAPLDRGCSRVIRAGCGMKLLCILLLPRSVSVFG